jgi:hypothetical protein
VLSYQYYRPYPAACGSAGDHTDNSSTGFIWSIMLAARAPGRPACRSTPASRSVLFLGLYVLLWTRLLQLAALNCSSAAVVAPGPAETHSCCQQGTVLFQGINAVNTNPSAACRLSRRPVAVRAAVGTGGQLSIKVTNNPSQDKLKVCVCEHAALTPPQLTHSSSTLMHHCQQQLEGITISAIPLSSPSASALLSNSPPANNQPHPTHTNVVFTLCPYTHIGAGCVLLAHLGL